MLSGYNDDVGVVGRLASQPIASAMLPLASPLASVILAFASLFVHRLWSHAQPFLIGTILAHGHRRVTSILRIIGRTQERRSVNVQRILE